MNSVIIRFLLLTMLFASVVTCLSTTPKSKENPSPATSSPILQDLGMFAAAREESLPHVGEWRFENGVFENAIPPNATTEDIRTSKDGIGVSLALYKDFEAADCVMECILSIKDTAAAGLVFRAQEKDGVVKRMYMAVLSRKGIDVYLFGDRQWTHLYQFLTAVAPSKAYALQIALQGERMSVTVDGEPAFQATDAQLTYSGKVGICGREGQARFVGFTATSLDKSKKGIKGLFK